MPSSHRHFDHGYAVTSHSSQGLTAERVLINADTGVHPDLLNSRFGYVSISRASHEATVFTDDMAKLSPQLSADVSKTSALEFNQAPSIAQGIGMM
jgi:ATP-dependent exoDNAse (exonuclease V) alpha subunit